MQLETGVATARCMRAFSTRSAAEKQAFPGAQLECIELRQSRYNKGRVACARAVMGTPVRLDEETRHHEGPTKDTWARPPAEDDAATYATRCSSSRASGVFLGGVFGCGGADAGGSAAFIGVKVVVAACKQGQMDD